MLGPSKPKESVEKDSVDPREFAFLVHEKLQDCALHEQNIFLTELYGLIRSTRVNRADQAKEQLIQQQDSLDMLNKSLAEQLVPYKGERLSVPDIEVRPINPYR